MSSIKKFMLMGMLENACLVYYVDATAGNDTSNGLSPATAWKTITKVNATSLLYNDRVRFKRGETWTEETLVPHNGVTYADFSTGNKPIIDGNLAADCIIANGKNNVTLQNLDLRNALDYGIGCGANGTPAYGIRIIDCDVSNPGNDGVIFIDGAHDCTITGGTISTIRNRTGTYTSTCIEIADGAYNITASWVTCSGSINHGISVHAHTGESMPYSILISGCSFNNNAQRGISIIAWNGSTAPASPGIIFTGCTATGNTLNGVVIGRESAAVAYPTHVTMNGCVIGGTPANAYQAILRGANHTFTWNMFYAPDTSNRGVYLETLTNSSFQNNSLYVESGTVFLPVLALVTSCANLNIQNNVISTASTGNLCILVDATSLVGHTIDYNLYYSPSGAAANRWSWNGTNSTWANWKTNSGQDAHSPAPADPLFVDAANDDFHLQAGSPAINKGVVIAGVTDGYLGAAPDCGAYEKA